MTPSLGQLTRVFGRIGLLSFGGPAAQIAVMHRELVAERPWLTEAQFLRGLSFCMLLPGPEAMQLATYAGWRKRGIPGGLIAGLLFVMPGAVLILILALFYGAYGRVGPVQDIFSGVQAAVVVIVVAALRKVWARALHGLGPVLIALAAFVALAVFALPFPLVIALSAMVGAVVLPRAAAVPEALPSGSALRSLSLLAVGCLIWVAPLPLAWSSDLLRPLALFFAKLAVVTFGGAYAVLAYMAQTIVQDHGWITAPQMLDALGLAETTPGPLILVTAFVGTLAGLLHAGVPTAIAAWALTLWMTFVPCFVFIFAGAPLIDWLSGRPRLQAALGGVTAAVVGVIANLSLWFALHVFCAALVPISFGPAHFLLPDLGQLRPVPIAIAMVAALLLLVRHWGLMQTLAVCAGLGLLAGQVTL